MLDDDRFEVLEIDVRPDARLADRPIADLPGARTTAGAIVRDGTLRFPAGDERLRAGDRVIVLTEPDCVTEVEHAL
jgi:trk system potassium uptake protein TrkA